MRLELNSLNKYFNSFKISSKLIYALLLMFIFTIVFLPISFASLHPVKSIEIYSENLNYQNNEPGAWKVTQSAKWISKNEAELTIDVNSIPKNDDKGIDTLLVIDTSLSNEDLNYSLVYNKIRTIVDNLMNNSNNKVGLISFSTSSEIISNFTNDKEKIISGLSNLQIGGLRNYYKAFEDIDKVLNDYKIDKDKECIVLFLTYGYPNIGGTVEASQYTYLKNKYSFISIKAVQYNCGDEIIEALRNVSDNQYASNKDNIESILNEILNKSIAYDKFKITYEANLEKFFIDKNEIKQNYGNIKFDSSKHQVIWEIDDVKSGQDINLKIVLKQKDNLEDVEGLYLSTNELDVFSMMDKDIEDVKNNQSPIISNSYKVSYDANVPSDCVGYVTPGDKEYLVFDTVEKSSVSPYCDSYQFKGWKIINNDINTINNDYFVMPEEDVYIKGTWSKLDISKTMDGTVKENLTLYKQVQEDFKDLNKYVKKYTGDSSTFNGSEDVYYYYGAATDNNVIFANYCWKIVRTTDTGGVKLLYNGVPSNEGKCNNVGDDTQLTAKQMNTDSNKVPFNTKKNSLADVGYMYNTRYEYKNLNVSTTAAMLYGNSFIYAGGTYTLTNTISATGLTLASEWTKLANYHYTCFNTSGVCTTLAYVYYSANTTAFYIELNSGENIDDALNKMLYNNNVNLTSSTIKKCIDYFYSKNIIKYANMLEDTFWCNDRNILNRGSTAWNPNGGQIEGNTFFNSHGNSDNLTCSNVNDRFTVNTESGNGALTYPIGLITWQEQNLAYVSGVSPLITTSIFWTLSPRGFNSYHFYARNFYAKNTIDALSHDDVDIEYGVRPAVSLKASAEYLTGDGSSDNPYIIFTD